MRKRIIATDNTLKDIIYEEIEKYGYKADLNHIDVSNVKFMNCMFDNSNFNGDISKWDVSNVKVMYGMFDNSNFNGDISKWDVSNVNYMGWMFYNSNFTGKLKINGNWKHWEDGKEIHEDKIIANKLKVI